MATSRVLRFGTDGVRGRAGDDLSSDAVKALGRAAARVLGTERVFVVARDTRESGPDIERALAEGLTAEGAKVESAGVLPTPGLAYLSQRRALPAAMISASHNPFHDNGIKLFAPGGRKLTDDIEGRIEAAMHELGPAPDAALAGTVPAMAAGHAEYADHLVGALEGRMLTGLRVVVDCAHGAAFEVAPEVLRRLGADVDVLAAEPDGRNINADCGSTHPERLQQRVRDAGAHAGLAFDGDADRLIAADEQGNLLDGDHVLAVAGLDLRARGRLKHETIVTTVMANLGFRRAMDVHGINIVETAVGDRYVLDAMDAGGYSLGGEQSGHFIFADLATTGDGILSGLVLLDILHRSGRSLSELASVVTKLPQVLLNVPVTNREGLSDASQFWDAVAVAEAELGSGGRVLVRPSGTEPLVRVMVEATSEAEAESRARHLAEVLGDTLGAQKG